MSLCGQQCVKLAATLKIKKVVTSTDMLIVNKNLRHGMASVCPCHHFLSQVGISGNVDFRKPRIF